MTNRPNIYSKLGIRRAINCFWPGLTSFGAQIMPPEVVEAMVEASKYNVDMSELHLKAGEVIAEVMGAEAGCCCNCASAGLMMATAACMCGPDQLALSRLPDTTGVEKTEVLVQFVQVSPYESGFGNIFEKVGAKLVILGCTFGSRLGPMMRRYPPIKPAQREPYFGMIKEMEDNISDKTAAILYVTGEGFERFMVPLEPVIEVAHENGVPVIVDAALEADLRWPIKAGADIVVCSGGKYLCGPSSTGIIYGRKDFVEACELMEWNLARPMKVSKEDMVASISALKEYEKRDWSKWCSCITTREQGTKYAKYIYEKLSSPPIPNAKVELNHPTPREWWAKSPNRGLRVPPFFEKYPPIPAVRITPDKRLGMTIGEISRRLYDGDPRIGVYVEPLLGLIEIKTEMLAPGDEKIIAERVREVLTKK